MQDFGGSSPGSPGGASRGLLGSGDLESGWLVPFKNVNCM